MSVGGGVIEPDEEPDEEPDGKLDEEPDGKKPESALAEAERALANASADRDEASKVYSWRLTYLLRTGLIGLDDAEAIARSGCDLHQAGDLLLSGCPLELAVAILV